MLSRSCALVSPQGARSAWSLALYSGYADHHMSPSLSLFSERNSVYSEMFCILETSKSSKERSIRKNR